MLLLHPASGSPYGTGLKRQDVTAQDVIVSPQPSASSVEPGSCSDDDLPLRLLLERQKPGAGTVSTTPSDDSVSVLLARLEPNGVQPRHLRYILSRRPTDSALTAALDERGLYGVLERSRKRRRSLCEIQYISQEDAYKAADEKSPDFRLPLNEQATQYLNKVRSPKLCSH